MGKIKGNDCCCSDWKSVIKELWEKYQNVVKSIKWYGKTNYPDGDGMVILPELDLNAGVGLIDQTDFWTLITTQDGNATLTDRTTYYELSVI